MSLKNYYNKKVHIIDSTGKELNGFVDTYTYPEDNEIGKESIVVKTDTISVEFSERDIKTIEEIKAS